MLTTVLQYSTIDFRFLEANLNQITKFSKEVIIPICDHFFNGSPESNTLLEKTYEIASKFSNVSIYEFPWEGKKTHTSYYHNLSRAIGTSLAKTEWILFVDADEIVEDTFSDWFDTVKNTDLMYWLTCYWYFREPTLQATKFEAAGLLIRKEQCHWNLLNKAERQQLFNQKLVYGYETPILSKNNEPMLHHFSWVRTKDDMLKKVENWGHQGDKNWTDLIHEEFSREFNGTDFVHGYQYNIVPNKYNV